MTDRSKIVVTAGLILFLVVLGVVDYQLSGDRYIATTDPNGSSQSKASSVSSAITGTPKQTGPNVQTTIEALSLSTAKSSDMSFIAQVATSDATIQSLTILDNNDRAGSVTWIDSTQVKTSFIALKEALLGAFSPLVSDLHDETKDLPSGPTANILTFMDPSLSTERLTFVRIRQRLYEFHIVQGKEDTMQRVIDAMTK